MVFNSFDFAVFFTAVFLLQLVLRHRPRNVLLLGAGYFFYACWDWRFLWLVWATTAIAYLGGWRIHRSKAEGTRRAYLVASVGCHLVILGFFKYANFFIDSAQALLCSVGVNAASTHLDVILPVGISFYTFQAMTYSIDIYRREMEPVRNPIDFALFTAFFPQMLAGPIERATRLLPQMTRKPAFRVSSFAQGGWLVFWGLFKKVVVADNLAQIVGQVFDGQTVAAGGEALVASYAYAIQIYADFSGYSDMARGLAKMMGYELMLNFRCPYFAVNPQDFWRRWHVSLSSWFLDYVYIPLGGNRHGALRTYRNLLLTMLLCGLWHGAGWTFVLWGAYHGILLAGHRLAAGRKWLPCPRGGVWASTWWTVRVLGMFHLACLGWVLFRAESLHHFGRLVVSLGSGLFFSTNAIRWAWQIGILSAPLFLVEALQERSGDTDVVLGLSTVARTAIYAVILAMIVSLGQFGSQEFIYFQF